MADQQIGRVFGPPLSESEKAKLLAGGIHKSSALLNNTQLRTRVAQLETERDQALAALDALRREVIETGGWPNIFHDTRALVEQVLRGRRQ